MDANDVLALGLGVRAPWKLVGQRLDRDKQPNELHLEVATARGALFACPDCGRLCKAHDFAEFTWRHLNFFQHHCTITAKVPRTNCPEHGVKRIQVPWAREGMAVMMTNRPLLRHYTQHPKIRRNSKNSHLQGTILTASYRAEFPFSHD